MKAEENGDGETTKGLSDADGGRAEEGRGAGGNSLGSGVVQLVLPGPGEAALHATVRPQPLDDPGQVVRQEALLLRRRRQGEQLAGVVLADGQSFGQTLAWVKTQTSILLAQKGSSGRENKRGGGVSGPVRFHSPLLTTTVSSDKHRSALGSGFVLVYRCHAEKFLETFICGGKNKK